MQQHTSSVFTGRFWKQYLKPLGDFYAVTTVSNAELFPYIEFTGRER
jgi:hypothetical protein